MKKIRSFISIVLVLSLLIGLVPFGALAAPESRRVPFSDVKSTDWFYEPVEYAYENGLMTGTGSNIFSPNLTTTRGMIVTILHRMEGEPSAKAAGFSDVPHSRYYAGAIDWASANGIVSGYGDGRFGPDDPITREQMASIMYRYSEYKEYDTSASANLNRFKDGSSVSNYAKDVMRWAVGSGLLSGRTADTLAPKGQTTRAEAATILMRYCEQIINNSLEKPEETTFTVTFDSAGGSTVVSQKVKKGDTVSRPKDPSYEGYSFEFWRNKGECEQYDFSTPVIKDLSLEAVWSKVLDGKNSIYTLKKNNVVYDKTARIHYVNNILLAFTKSNLTAGEKKKLAESVNGSIAGDISGSTNILQIKVQETNLEELNNKAAILMNSPQVYFARYDSPVQADSIADDLTVEVAGDKTDWWYSAVNADDAWEEYAKYFSPITVGVIDNAIDVDNADLSGKVSFPDAQYRADNDAEIKAGANDHGTKVSQVFIGRDDDFGVTGIAHNANIVFVSKESETLPDTEEWRSSVPILYSVSRLVESGAKVINCSFGITVYGEEKFKEKYSDSFSSYSEYSKYVMDMSTDYAELAAAVVCELIENGMEDFIIVQSAGNGLDNTGETGIPTVLGGWWRGITEANSQSICKKYGISYDKLDDHILIAGSITDETPNPSYQMHLGCSYGDNVDIYAPGVNIFQKNDGGTSFSAPMVSGVAALVWSVDPSLTSAQVKDTLLSNHSKYASGIFMNKLYQKPVVDAYEAVKAIVSDTYTLKGKIINSATNKPVSDASISYTSKASGKVISTTSREDGSFELTLTAQPGSEESIVFKKKSYYDDSKKIAFSDAQVIDLGNIVFKPMVILEVPEAVATLLGKTVDSSSGSSIEGANISILDTNDSSLVTSATSTSNGDFKIELKSSGTYDIEISKEGYSTIVQSNTYIPSGNTNIGNIEMTVNKTEFAGGKGTKDDPYQIATAAQLNAVRTDLDAHYIQTKDISLAEYSNWEPIGTDNGAFSYEDTGFCGNYNGNGHTISDLTIKDNISVGSIGKHDGYAAALFGVSDSCYIEQVILEDVNIDIDATEGVAPELIAIGGILAKGNTEAGAGSSNTIFACTVASGTISFYNAVDNNGELYIGGLSAIGFGASSENYATINVTGLTSVQGPEVFCGGISALAASAHTCENYGDIRVIIPSSICCGGITGLYTSGGWMYYCNNYGDIFVASDDVSNRNVYAGGIFGGNYANPQVFMCKDYAGVTVGQIS